MNERQRHKRTLRSGDAYSEHRLNAIVGFGSVQKCTQRYRFAADQRPFAPFRI
jgi:hypothetical protein